MSESSRARRIPSRIDRAWSTVPGSSPRRRSAVFLSRKRLALLTRSWRGGAERSPARGPRGDHRRFLTGSRAMRSCLVHSLRSRRAAGSHATRGHSSARRRRCRPASEAGDSGLPRFTSSRGKVEEIGLQQFIVWQCSGRPRCSGSRRSRWPGDELLLVRNPIGFDRPSFAPRRQGTMTNYQGCLKPCPSPLTGTVRAPY